MSKKTPQKRVLFARCNKPLLLLLFLMISTALVLITSTARSYAGAASTINFQARLLTAAGNVVPDGNYDVEFKLYNASSSSGSSQGSCTGDVNCLWTETRTSANQVRVVNGYLTVSLGSVTPFSTSINWDQDLYLTMNIGGTGSSPSWDGEMNPRLHLTAVPYAFRAGTLANYNGSTESTLNWITQTAANTIQLPNASGTICLQSSASCGFLTGSASSYIQNTTSPQSSNIDVQAATSGSVAATLMANSGGTGDILDLQNGSGTNVATFGSTGSILLKPSTNSTSAFQIQPSGSTTSVLDVDTTNSEVGIGTNTPSRSLDVAQNSSQNTAPMELLDQAGSGDASLEFRTPTKSFILGSDGSASGTFKISSSTASATSTATMGKTTTTGSADSGSGTVIGCQQFTAASDGVVTSMTVYETGSVGSSPNNLFQVAIYGNSSGQPGSLLANSASTAIVGNSWNTVSVASVSVTSGSAYWLCYQTNALVPGGNNFNNLPFETGPSGEYASYDGQTPANFGTWSSSLGTPSHTGTAEHAIYATYTVAGSSFDSFNRALFQLSDTGEAHFQVSQNATDAFQVQSQSGTAIMNVDTINGAITLQSSSNSATSFQVLNSLGASNLVVDSGSGRVIIGNGTTGYSSPNVLVLNSGSSSSDPTASTVAISGAMYYNASKGQFRCNVSGVWENCIGGLMVSSNTVTTAASCTTACANITTATNGWPANYCTAGRVYHLFASGTYSTTGTPTLGINVYLGTSSTLASDTQIGSTVTTATVGGSGMGWQLDAYLICSSATSVTIHGSTTFSTSSTTGTSSNAQDFGATTITNSTQNIYLFPTWSANSASNTVTCNQFILQGM